MVYIKLIASALLLFSVSCTSVKPTQNHITLSSWIDTYYVDAIYQLGDPLYIFSDGLSGKVLVYENVLDKVNFQSLGSYDESYIIETQDMVWNQSTTRTIPPRIAQTTDLLYVDKDGGSYSIQSNKSNRKVRQKHENNAIIVGVVSISVLLILLLTAE